MEQRVQSGSPYEDQYGFARALRVGNRVEVAGTAPIPPAGDPVAPTAYEQMVRCGAIATSALAELGASPGDVVRTRMFIVDAGDADDIGRAHAEVFGVARPVATMVVVGGLLDPAWKVEIEVEAVIREAESPEA
jgi:enamine deaminase RidA (YjgF/YER057c/UK114 family)